MSQIWYYADRQNQQQGPVAQSWLINAAQRGEISANTLVWREGLAAWVPLAQVAGELGISLAGAPPTLPKTVRVNVVKPSGAGSSTWVIVAIVVIVGFVAIAGIVAAIAIPAYADYTLRAKISQARLEGIQLKIPVAEFYAQEERCPENGEGGIRAAEDYAGPYVAAIHVGATDDAHCAVQVMLKGLDTLSDDAHILMRMSSDLQWSESSNVPNRYLPASMRR